MANKYHPVHAINRYLWSRIEEEGILNKADYEGMVPIVPIEETPDLLTVIQGQEGISTRPYIVYTWNKVNTGQMWFMKTHQVAYSVRSPVDLGSLINLFEHEFEQYDKSAQKVNSYLSTLPDINGILHPLRKWKFQYISVSTLGGGLPAESENGVNEALITITATFTG